MADTISHQIHEILYTSPSIDLSSEDIRVLNTLPIDAVQTILRRIYITETNRNVIGKTYDAILSLHQLDTVEFFIDVLAELAADGRTTCCQTLGDFADRRAIVKLCQVLVEDADPIVRYFAIEAVTNHGDATVFPALAYVRDHATDVDYEGRPVADTARWAIGKISRRTSPA